MRGRFGCVNLKAPWYKEPARRRVRRLPRRRGGELMMVKGVSPSGGTWSRRAWGSAVVGGVALAAGFLPTPAVCADHNIIGAVSTYVVEHDDTLLDVARRFDVGFVALVAANPGVDPWLPGEGLTVDDDLVTMLLDDVAPSTS